jgi:alkaline phosphatase D
MNRFFYLLIFSILFTNLGLAQEMRSSLKAGQAPFFHGVASGDPMADKVMIWTKLTPPTGSLDSIPVYWQIATDVNFNNVVNFGNTKAVAAKDFTIKIDVCGLQGATYYYYVFRALGQNSITGRTKTAPATGGTDARFGVVSCSSYEHGYFNAYESLAKRNDLDAILHLGDYIYEYESGGFSSSVVTGSGRIYQPSNEVITLTEYRIRHSHYKLDDQLQLLHQIHPFITTWDDHETANDSYKDGAQNHDSATEGSWITRKVSGTQAYAEYMPIRNPDPNDNLKIWRNLRYGNLLDLIVLDSRLWARDLQDLSQTNSTSRNLLGNDQFVWLENRLSDNTTQWKIICQQVMMAPLQILGIAVNSDQWDGYNKDRNRLINYIENNNIQNPVVLTGDIHTSWVNNVPGNATTTAAVEFVVTSVTSPGLDVIETALGQLPQWLLNAFGGAATGVITGLNPHMKYANLEDHGYMVLTVNQAKAQGDYVWLDRETIDTTNTAGPSYYTNNGVSSMTAAAAAIAPIIGGAPVPSPNANQNLPFALLLDTFQINVIEGQFFSNCLINVSNSCPNLTTSLLNPPSFGTAAMNQFCITYQGINNYYGQDYFSAVFCQTANPSNCDTVVVSVNVQATSNLDTLAFQITNDSTLIACVTFNDLVASGGSVSVSGLNSGSFSIDSNNCFTYSPDSTFNGIHYIGLISCDSLNICDTLVLQITVGSLNATTYVELFGANGELISNCLGFDDLQGSIVSSGIINLGSNNALIFGDTCLSYISQTNYSGTDTVVLYACDNAIPQICDTIVYWIQITTTIIDTTGITDLVNNDFAVMGVYPNPFDVEILVQYYQFSNQTITLGLYDVSGKQLFYQNIGETSEGLKYARLETNDLPVGNYIIELSTSENTFTKKLVKF